MVTDLLSSVVLFRAFLFAGVPYVLLVAKILQRVVEVFLYQVGKVLYLPDYRTDTIVSYTHYSPE